MKILFACSEARPFLASGGLADVTGSLPKEIRAKGHSCKVVMPLYSDIPEELRKTMSYVTDFTVPLAWRNLYCGIYEANHCGVTYFFIDNEYYFKRPGLYGYYDDGERFAFFSRAVLEMLHYLSYKPDIIHCNDWQTALIPVYLNVCYRHDPDFKNIKTILTIHNIQYQGQYGLEMIEDVIGMSKSLAPILEYNGDVNYLKAGICQCDLVTTVSPSYAKEILDPYFAHGLEHILRDRQFQLAGILNGIDTVTYNPEKDSVIYKNFCASKPKNKKENKLALQQELGLPADQNIFLLGIVSRLAEHKGFDLLMHIDERLMEYPLQMVVLGSGEQQYEEYFYWLAKTFPQKVSFIKGFVPDFARKIYAGSDGFLMPSKSEPCGLAQMLALRYGTIPIVRETGGLRDSIKDLGGENGNGFTFQSFNAHDMLGAILRALELFEEKPRWNQAVKNALSSDFSWNQSAAQYVALYRRLLDRIS